MPSGLRNRYTVPLDFDASSPLSMGCTTAAVALSVVAALSVLGPAAEPLTRLLLLNGDATRARDDTDVSPRMSHRSLALERDVRRLARVDDDASRYPET